MYEYFKIYADNDTDNVRIRSLLKDKQFFPGPSSNPPLPAHPKHGFDYRMLFKPVEFAPNWVVVKTRSKYSLEEFSINVIPALDWVVKYGMSKVPTISATLDGNHSMKVDDFPCYEYKALTSKRGLLLTFTNTTSLTLVNFFNPLLVISDINDVNQWNKYFKLPELGHKFENVEVTSTTVRLIGCYNFTIAECSLGACPELIAVEDETGCVSAVESYAFFRSVNIGEVCLPWCMKFGNSTTSNNVFTGIYKNDISLVVPKYIMTCNDGEPDADVTQLKLNNKVNILET